MRSALTRVSLEVVVTNGREATATEPDSYMTFPSVVTAPRLEKHPSIRGNTEDVMVKESPTLQVV